MKKGLKKFAVILAAVSLTGCQNDIEPVDIIITTENSTKSDLSEAIEATDISIGEAAVTDEAAESADISTGETVVTDSGEEDFIPKLLMDTDKPFVRAEDNYIIEKRNIDVSAFNEHGIPSFAADGKYFYSEHSIEENSSHTEVIGAKESYIYVYDTESGEYSRIFSEECSKDTNILYYNFAALRDNYLYYFREEGRFNAQSSTSEGYDLCRLNLDTKQSEHIFSLNNETFWGVKDQVDIIGNSLYFYDFHDSNHEYVDFVRTIYRLDLDTGETAVFRDDADYVMPYKNGLIYYHDGGYYYHGEDKDIRGKGVFYEGDELLFYFDQEQDPYQITAVVVTKGDTIIYGFTDYESEECVVGIFDENYNQTEIASPKKGTWYFYVYSCEISESGLVFFDAPKPLIYDKITDSFALIPIDHYAYRYATEDGICFFVFDYADDDYDNYLSAALYTVKRR